MLTEKKRPLHLHLLAQMRSSHQKKIPLILYQKNMISATLILMII